MSYLLDTNALSGILDRRAMSERLAGIRRDAVFISSVVLYEAYFGAFKSGRQAFNLARLDMLQFPVVEFDNRDALEAGRIRWLLQAAGTPIGSYDVLIAGQALARDMVLVTHNTREFSRVEGLKIEDWES